MKLEISRFGEMSRGKYVDPVTRDASATEEIYEFRKGVSNESNDGSTGWLYAVVLPGNLRDLISSANGLWNRQFYARADVRTFLKF